MKILLGKQKFLILNLAFALISSLLLNGSFADENSSGVFPEGHGVTAFWQVGTINFQSIVQSRTPVNSFKAHPPMRQGNRAVVKVDMDSIPARQQAGVGSSLSG